MSTVALGHVVCIIVCASPTFDIFRKKFILANHDIFSSLTQPKKDNCNKVWSVLSLVYNIPCFHSNLGIIMRQRDNILYLYLCLNYVVAYFYSLSKFFVIKHDFFASLNVKLCNFAIFDEVIKICKGSNMVLIQIEFLNDSLLQGSSLSDCNIKYQQEINFYRIQYHPFPFVPTAPCMGTTGFQVIKSTKQS